MKVLVVLANFGYEQINYLKRVVEELKSFEKYEVSILVHSNVSLMYLEGICRVGITLDDYQLLPLTCRKSIWDRRHDYDVFLYGENDHLFREIHLDRFLEYNAFLPKNIITGLIQYEDGAEELNYPAFHRQYRWLGTQDFNGHRFAEFSNLHQGTFIITREQLLRMGKNYNFTRFFGKDRGYSRKCRVNTDIYGFEEWRKLICISDFEDNLIHHLPNNYDKGSKGRNKLGSHDTWMKRVIQDMMTLK